MEIFVGNLSFSSTDSDLKKLFSGFGSVVSAVIVMRKEKKAPKSRGFGFVEMPNEQEALSAVTALDAKEFMGRIINVEVARLKSQSQPEQRKKLNPAVKAKQHPLKDKEGESQFIPLPLAKPGKYRGGRRSISYIKRRGLSAEEQEFKPRRRTQDNPMRWRKKKNQLKPWQKAAQETKSGKKAGGKSRQPWEKTTGIYS
jgi:RNA recognition motif-containing protein